MFEYVQVLYRYDVWSCMVCEGMERGEGGGDLNPNWGTGMRVRMHPHTNTPYKRGGNKRYPVNITVTYLKKHRVNTFLKGG